MRTASLLSRVLLVFFLSCTVLTAAAADKPLKAALVMLVFMFITAYAVKKTALIYYTPPIMACLFLALFGNQNGSRRNIKQIAWLALASLSLLYLTRRAWMTRINTTFDAILAFPNEFLFNAMLGQD